MTAMIVRFLPAKATAGAFLLATCAVMNMPSATATVPGAAATHTPHSFKGRGSCLTLDGKMPPRRAKGDGATHNDPFAGTEADCKVTPRCRVDVRARLTPTTPAPAPLGAEPECGQVWCSGSASPTQPHPPRARNAAAGHACRLPPPSSPHAAADSPAVACCPCACFLLCHRTFVRTWEKSARRSRILLRVANAI